MSAESNLRLIDCGIDFKTPFYGIESIDFNEIDASFVLKDSRLKIARITGSGNDMDADISGSVMVRKNMDKSVLLIKIDPALKKQNSDFASKSSIPLGKGSQCSAGA